MALADDTASPPATKVNEQPAILRMRLVSSMQFLLLGGLGVRERRSQRHRATLIPLGPERLRTSLPGSPPEPGPVTQSTGSPTPLPREGERIGPARGWMTRPFERPHRRLVVSLTDGARFP